MICFQFLLLLSFKSVWGRNNRGYSYEPPEIIQNDPPDQFGYNYPVPNPPFFEDPPSTPNYLYGPPSLDLPHPNVTLPPISNDIPDYPAYLPPPQYEPPPLETPPNEYLPPSSLYDTPSLKFRISNMTCLDSPVNGYFRATMGLSRSLSSLPVVDDAPANCISGSGEVYRLELEGDKMKRCGVRFCSNGLNMCVTIRMPTVRGLKLPEDPVVMLRCRPQDRVVAHTKHLRISASNTIQQARSVQPSHVITGGSQRGFDTQVALFRRSGTTSGGEFNKVVAPGAAVQLGEELMLRAAVREGDGWRYSRLGDVTVHHVTGNRVRQRAITLLDSAGCRDARVRAVVPLEPTQPTPLVTTLQFRAFMFQGMSSGDDMVMSVRMFACLQIEDCLSKNRCGDPSQRRLRRQTSSRSISNNTNAFNSYLEFKVIASNTANTSNTFKVSDWKPRFFKSNVFHLLATVIVSFLVLVGVACLITYAIRRK